MLKDMIKSAPGYRLAARGETPEFTVMNLCAAGFAALGEKLPELSWGEQMEAAASFFPALFLETQGIEKEIFEVCGLAGGAKGYSTLADLSHLTSEEALKVFHITFAMRELGMMHVDLIECVDRQDRAA